MTQTPRPAADRAHERAMAARLDRVTRRLEANELALEQLRNTVYALARETDDITVGHPCDRCGRVLLLIREGTMYCPQCSYRRSM